MDNSKNNPGKVVVGNANLPIGGVNSAKIGGVKDAATEFSGEKNANREIGAPRWHSRGYLPHFESSDVTQHVTFHLADSLPQTVLLPLEAELKFLPTERRDAERRKRVDAWIDAGHGSCVLRKPAIAGMVQGSLLHGRSSQHARFAMTGGTAARTL